LHGVCIHLSKRREDNMSLKGKNKMVTYDLARFAGTIGYKGRTFIGIIKVTISLSVFFALLMLLAKS